MSSPGYGDQADMYMREHTSGTATPALEHPCQPLRKIISAGTFYYAMEPQWDISSRLQRRLSRNEPWDAATFDDRFVWNEYIVRSLLDFRERLDVHEREELDQCQFIVRPVLLIVDLVPMCSPGVGHSRLRWCMHSSPACTSNEWNTHHRHSIPDITAWMETRWHTIQHSRCG